MEHNTRTLVTTRRPGPGGPTAVFTRQDYVGREPPEGLLTDIERILHVKECTCCGLEIYWPYKSLPLCEHCDYKATHGQFEGRKHA